MGLLILVLLVAGAVCFGIAAFGAVSRPNVLALGLLCWIATAIIPRV